MQVKYVIVDTLGSPVPGKYRTYLDAYKRLCTEPRYTNYIIEKIDYERIRKISKRSLSRLS